MKKKQTFYIWMIPLIWAIFSILQFREPGDDYGLYAFSSFVGVWILFLTRQGDVHSLIFPLSITLAGTIVMLLIGLWMDKVRIRKIIWIAIYIISVLAIFYISINAYPSIEHALSKNGSWWAYIFFSINMGLHVSILLSFFGKGIGSIWKKIKN